MGKQSRGSRVRRGAERKNPERVDIKVAVCVPGERWKAGFGFSVSNMMVHFATSKYTGGNKSVELIAVSGSMLHELRTDLVRRAMVAGATHMLFLDDDMQFPVDLLNRLISHNKPVVGCNYSRRCIPPIPTSHGLDDEPVYTRPDSTGLESVAHLGTGSMLIDMRVFEHLDATLGLEAMPWFQFGWRETENPDLPPRPEGEDVYFCKKLRRAGVPIYVDHDASQNMVHLGEWEYRNDQCAPSEIILKDAA